MCKKPHTKNDGKDAAYVSFHHGALCDSYEKQANKQGFTLGDKAQYLQELESCLIKAHIHGLLTDSEYDRSLRRLQQQLMRALDRLRPPEEAQETDDS